MRRRIKATIEIEEQEGGGSGPRFPRFRIAALRWVAAISLVLVLLAAAIAVVILLLQGSDDGDASRDPEDFAEFAKQIARAAEREDAAFFGSRVRGTTYTCTEEQVEASIGPDAPPDPICTEVGIQYERVLITNYGAAGAAAPPLDVIRNIQDFFVNVRFGETDEYGPAQVRLYATAIPDRAGEENLDRHTAIITAIHDITGVAGRVARGLDFEYVDGRWQIRALTNASFPIAVDLLSASSATVFYRDWTRYEQ